MYAFYSKYRLILCKYFSGRIDNSFDAEDMVQEVFYRIVRSKYGKSDSCPESYLYAIAKSIIVDKYRRDEVRNVKKHVDLAEYVDELVDDNFLDDVSADLLFQRFLDAVSQLPETYKRVFILVRFENYGYDEAAEHLNCSRGNISRIMVTSLKKIKETMQHEKI